MVSGRASFLLDSGVPSQQREQPHRQRGRRPLGGPAPVATGILLSIGLLGHSIRFRQRESLVQGLRDNLDGLDLHGQEAAVKPFAADRPCGLRGVTPGFPMPDLLLARTGHPGSAADAAMQWRNSGCWQAKIYRDSPPFWPSILDPAFQTSDIHTARRYQSPPVRGVDFAVLCMASGSLAS